MKRSCLFRLGLALTAMVLILSVICLPAPITAGEDILPFEPNDTLEDIRYKIDQNGYDFTVDHNWVFDMPSNEKASFFSRYRPLSPRRYSVHDEIGPLAKYLGLKTLPGSFDWRDYNGRSYIGSIRDQGLCGSCYAFGAAAAAEGSYNWITGSYDGDRADFSEAFIAFCLSDNYSGFDGCFGANYDYDELQALVDYGICTETDYPYSDHEQSCPFGTYPSLTQFQSWHRVPCADIEAIKTAIMTYGVVDVAVYVDSAFQSYDSGVYENTNTDCIGDPCYYTISNHAVALVGWDDSPPEGGGGCWILRNSWGTGWGESGYMRIRYTSAVVTCSVSYLVYQSPMPASLKIQAANVSKVGTFAMNQSIRIFQGLEPGVALLQEWALAEGTHREYVDEAFGPEFYYYLAYTNRNPVGDSWAMPNGIVSRWAMQTWGGVKDTSGSNLPYFAWAIIDLPGDTDLGVISVHLKAGSSVAEKEQRVEQANLIKAFVEDNFDTANDYIVVGGDINAGSADEWCVQSFATFLDPSTYRPADRNGNEYTNQNRTEPYDWIMPNLLLNNFQEPLGIGTENYQYTEGMVFDSHVFCRCDPAPTPQSGDDLWNLPPVEYGDSHSTMMDHMTVMVSFDVFPSPTPSPSTSPSPIPSMTPTPILPPSPSPVPTAEIVMGPISGRVYDRVTGDGIPSVYIRALAHGGVSTAISDSQGYYNTGLLNALTYTVYADTFDNRDYRVQYYDQRSEDDKVLAELVPSNTSGIDFPLYRRGAYPTPTPAPTPKYIPASIDSGDYDGDGVSDIAIFRRSSGLWAIREITRVYFGGGSDQPASGDYNGDGTSDIAIFRDSSGLWAIRSISRTYFGAGSDIPVPGDYNGDGICDIAIFRGATGLWAIKDETRMYFGAAGDWPVPYNGAQLEKYIAIYRPASGLWAVKYSTRCYFGGATDQPVPANYQGIYPDTAQLGIFRETTGLWAIRDTTRVYYGTPGDLPVPGNYRVSYGADITIFRETSGLWSVRGLTRVYFGSSGDLPVAGLAINPSSGGTP